MFIKEKKKLIWLSLFFNIFPKLSKCYDFIFQNSSKKESHKVQWFVGLGLTLYHISLN